jgi:hypothetical protein
MTDTARAAALVQRTNIDDLTTIGRELPEEHLRLAAGGNPAAPAGIKVRTYSSGVEGEHMPGSRHTI